MVASCGGVCLVSRQQCESGAVGWPALDRPRRNASRAVSSCVSAAVLLLFGCKLRSRLLFSSDRVALTPSMQLITLWLVVGPICTAVSSSEELCARAGVVHLDDLCFSLPVRRCHKATISRVVRLPQWRSVSPFRHTSSSCSCRNVFAAN